MKLPHLAALLQWGRSESLTPDVMDDLLKAAKDAAGLLHRLQMSQEGDYEKIWSETNALIKAVLVVERQLGYIAHEPMSLADMLHEVEGILLHTP